MTLLINKRLCITLKKKFIKIYVWSVLLSGRETQIIEKYKRDKIEAMEMWLWTKEQYECNTKLTKQFWTKLMREDQ